MGLELLAALVVLTVFNTAVDDIIDWNASNKKVGGIHTKPGANPTIFYRYRNGH
jgi:hypothetical protein